MRAHLDECTSCRALLADVGDLHAIYLSEIPSTVAAPDREREARTMNLILRGARDEGAHFSQPLRSAGEYEKPEIEFIESMRGIRGWTVGASLCALAVSLALAFSLGRRSALDGHRPDVPPQIAASSVPPSPPARAVEMPNREVEVLRGKLAGLEAEHSRLGRVLREKQSENEQLQHGNFEGQQQVAALWKELESARAEDAKLSQRVEQMSAEHESDQTAITAQNAEIRSLNERLDNQRASQERARDLIEAERDLHEWVGARNLHIVDVYDTDSRGKTQKAVGRVFYIEGKSLVFYAYDVSKGQSDSAKYAYYVWGNKDGNLDTVRNLGTLGTDDVQQRRWKLQVSDATVLADIDRVFVTIEPVGKLGPRPQGKKILSAYLGGPVNHP